MWLLFLIVGLLTIGTALYVWLAHVVFRFIYGWRRYQYVTVTEILFILVVTFPGVIGDSNFALIFPLGVGVVLSGVLGSWLWEILEFSGPDIGWGVAFYGLWLATTLLIMWLGIARRFQRKQFQ